MQSYLKCPVTALKFYNGFLLSGQGTRLVVYSLKSYQQVLSYDIFKCSRVHKICCSKDYPDYFIVLSGKTARCIKFTTADENFNVTFVTEEKDFKGWMWDYIQLSATQILLISAHNTVVDWDIDTNKDKVLCSCDQQCILYSATLSIIGDDIVVASGTVFNHMLLWKVITAKTDHTYISVWKKFIGHEGVIFRIRFHPDSDQLLSVSDDRSVRLWSIKDESCLKIFYGHTARVWDALFLNENIVSIGEDSVCILWNMDGQIQRKYSGHKGKSIWSLDTCGRDIYTGGGDGGIRIWSTTDNTVIQKGPLLEITLPLFLCKQDDYPRTLKLLSHDTVVMSTNNGCLLKWNIPEQKWVMLYSDVSFKSYCCVDSIDNFIAIANLCGCVKIISLDLKVLAEQSIFSGKIFNMIWLKRDHKLFLLLSGPDGNIKLLKYLPDSFELSVIASYQLPYSRQQWIAAADLFFPSEEEIMLICGDRRGSLHLYCLSSMNPVQSLLGAHGKTGVTSVTTHKNYVYTTGRDGKYRIYKLNSEKQLQMIDQKKSCRGMDWLEGIWFDKDDLIIYGFYMQSFFAAWSTSNNQLLFKIPCGGGYRAWDVKFPVTEHIEDISLLTFIYLKGPVINLLSDEWCNNSLGKVLQDDLHGRDIIGLKVIGKSTNYVSNKTFSLKTIHTVTGHIGGVKDIKFLPSTRDRTKLHGWFVSCGTRTSYKLWNLTTNIGFCAIQNDFNSSAESALNGMSSFTDIVTEFEKKKDSSAESALNGMSSFTDIVTEFEKKKDFSCSLIAEIFNPEISLKNFKLKNHDIIDDMRYMSTSVFTLGQVCTEQNKTKDCDEIVCCACACSDGIARIYFYDQDKFGLLTTLTAHSHCVQNITHLIKTYQGKKRCFIFTSATDGQVIIWDITEILASFTQSRKTIELLETQKGVNKLEAMNNQFMKEHSKIHVNSNKFKFHDINKPMYHSAPSYLLRCHQSGVNAMDIRVKDNDFILLTGGDDSMVCWKQVSFDQDIFTITNEVTHSNAHFSSVSAVKFISDSIVASTSIDQCVKIWRVVNNRVFQLLREIYTNIADVSNMEVWVDRDEVFIGVTGIGLEIFDFRIEELAQSVSDNSKK